MGTKIIVRLGNPDTTRVPFKVSQSLTTFANVRAIVSKSLTVLSNVLAAPVSHRFYGDPGVGNRYIGMEAAGGQLVNFQNFEGQLAHATQIRRLYNSGGTISGIVPNLNRAVADGKIPFQDLLPFNGPSINFGDFVAGTGATLTYLSDLATAINNVSPMPVIVGDNHEPFHTTKIPAGSASAYRADMRILYTYLRAHCPNAILCGPVYQYADFKTGSATRDWRTMHADWKGTSTTFAGGTTSQWNRPNPVDFYTPSVFDVWGQDLYNFWGYYTNGVRGGTWNANFIDLNGQYNLIYNIIKAVPSLAAQPWAIGEYGVVAYCGDPDHGWTNQSTVGHTQDNGSFSTANHNQFLTQMSDLHNNPNIFAFAYWNSGAGNNDFTGFTGGSVDIDTDPFNWHVEAMNAALADSRTVDPVKQ